MGENKGSSKNGILAALLANIPAITYGIQIGWLSPMTAVLQSSSVSDDVITWLAAALPLAAMVSVPMFTTLSDYLGRRKTIILLSVLSAISWILKLVAINPIGLISARIFAGIASSGCFLVIPVYIKEISNDKLRGALGSLLMLACNFGVILVYILGITLPYLVNQTLYLAISILHIVTFYFMPESPAFLIKEGKVDKAKESIAWLRGLQTNDNKITEEINTLNQEEILSQEISSVSFLHIFQEKTIFRPLIVCLILIAVQTLSGCFAIVNYASVIFRRAGGSWSPDYLALCVGALQLSGSLVAVSAVDKCGRKILLSTSSFVISLCMVAIGSCFVVSQPPTWLPVVAVCVGIFSYGAGLGPMPFVYMAEVFSFQLRARLVGTVMLLSWFDSTVTVLLFSTLANTFGEHVVFYAFATITMFGALYTIFFVPETKGRSLKDIQSKFGGKIN